MSSISIEIPNDVVQALKLPQDHPEEELRREFAVFLVREGLLPAHMARRLAHMERVEFLDLLARRQVPWEGTLDEVVAEVDDADRVLPRGT